MARCRQAEAAVRPSPVVVPYILVEYPFQVTLGDHEQVVEAILSNSTDPAFPEAFAFGERTGVRMVSAPIEANTLSKLVVKLVSRSEMRNRTRLPVCASSAQKLRATWVTQGPLGLAVTPRRWTTRRSSSMTNRTEYRRSKTVSTVKKSVATMPSAWARRNSVQVGPTRRGAG
jgi:hypothetical protein